MKIDSGTVGMESVGSYRASNITVRRFSITDYLENLTQGNDSLNAAIGENTENAGNTEENRSGEQTEDTAKTVPSLQDWQTRFQAGTAKVSMRSSVGQTYTDIREQTIRYIFELLFAARRNQLNRWLRSNGFDTENLQEVQSVQPHTLVTNVKVLSYSQETYFEETESADFSAVGTVKTTDGREINFNVNVGMSREFQEYYREDMELASFTMCDPLVINLDTDAVQLQDQTFYFDIDADGEQDEISRLGAGSGYLALDKNEDGIINDGSELFGTVSGNGFADLAKYDEDGNGWIDENDGVWDKLKIWAKDENGNDVLYRLTEKGVGAVCLQNVTTDFAQKGSGGQTLGAVRNTGVFLYENGNVGTVQHVDVAKYNKEA
ncbi:MAG: hypothetical protein MRZ49_01870 [Lachnospiraceae bacterium]|nr:hypothetical protein [Lachnospiraceae bacterium]